jgi:hypothetical protein
VTRTKYHHLRCDDVIQVTGGNYLWMGDYDRQVASTIDCTLKGDGRAYGIFLKTDSYFEGEGANEIWQAHFKSECVFRLSLHA